MREIAIEGDTLGERERKVAGGSGGGGIQREVGRGTGDICMCVRELHRKGGGLRVMLERHWDLRCLRK
jgi:hypothetical protein